MWDISSLMGLLVARSRCARRHFLKISGCGVAACEAEESKLRWMVATAEEKQQEQWQKQQEQQEQRKQEKSEEEEC